MIDSTLVSVIIPVYNREHLIEETVSSVLSQAFEGQLEVIVVDDGSTDSTAGVVREIQKSAPQLALIRQENSGPSAARNRGFAASRGQFIQFLDSDDILHQHKLRLQLQALEKTPDADFATCI